MWELHQWATTYGQDPPRLLGIDPRLEPWLAWQVRRAVFSWGQWFDARRQETVERPVPERQKPTMRVPKFTEKQLRQMLGLPEEAEVAMGYRTADGRVWSDAEIEALALDVLRGGLDDEDE